MKKTLLSAAAFAVVAVSAVAVAPTTSEAIPAFARQTGAACLSCHFQTFPAINGFGRAFKKGSFTDVGEQALVEDENLSIPSVLNATVVIRGNYTGVSSNAAGAVSTGVWSVPSETPILIAGRVGSNSGAFVEFANGGAGSLAAVTVGNWQFLNSFDVGDFKVGVGASNSTFGASAVMETSNVFGQHGGKLAGSNLSAVQASGFAGPIISVGVWGGNDMGDLQVALVAPQGAQGTNVKGKFATLVRAHGTFDISGFDTMVGFGFVSGSAGQSIGGGVGPVPMNMWFVDGQVQGEIGDTSVGVYADYANIGGKTNAAGVANLLNPTLGTNLFGFFGFTAAGTKDTGFGVRAEIKPLHNIGLGAGYRSLKSTTAAVATTLKTWQVAAFYEIYQNFEINLAYTNAKKATAGLSTTTKTTLVEFEALM